MNDKIVGLDLSLTSTGVASILPTGVSVDRLGSVPAGLDLLARYERLRGLAEQIRRWTVEARLVVIEGPSYGSRNGQQHDRSGLWWIVVSRLLSFGTPVAVAPPASRSKYATGVGNAAKDRVLACVLRRYPAVDVEGNDEADALLLAAMGARWLGEPIEASLPLAHLSALDGVAWPEWARTW